MKALIKVAAVLAAVWVVTPGCVMDTDTPPTDDESSDLGTAADELTTISCRQLCRPEKGAAKLQCLAECARYESAKTCRSDDDCNLYSDYCGGCNCDSMTRPLPASCAPQDQVMCFADPCLGKEPVCLQGRCFAL